MEGFCDINMVLILTLKYVESEFLKRWWKETGLIPYIPGKIPGRDSCFIPLFSIGPLL